MVFVHEWVQISDGSICAIELSWDLKTAVSEPLLLFHASWGCCLQKTEGMG